MPTPIRQPFPIEHARQTPVSPSNFSVGGSMGGVSNQARGDDSRLWRVKAPIAVRSSPESCGRTLCDAARASYPGRPRCSCRLRPRAAAPVRPLPATVTAPSAAIQPSCKSETRLRKLHLVRPDLSPTRSRSNSTATRRPSGRGEMPVARRSRLARRHCPVTLNIR